MSDSTRADQPKVKIDDLELNKETVTDLMDGNVADDVKGGSFYLGCAGTGNQTVLCVAGGGGTLQNCMPVRNPGGPGQRPTIAC